MYSASPLRGKEETLTIVHINLDNCPNFTYTKESSVTPVDNSGAFEHADCDYFPLLFLVLFRVYHTAGRSVCVVTDSCQAIYRGGYL